MLKHIFNNEIDFNNKDYEEFIKSMLYILTNPLQKEEELPNINYLVMEHYINGGKIRAILKRYMHFCILHFMHF